MNAVTENQNGNGKALAVVSNDVDVRELQAFNSLLNQETIIQMGDNLMGVHPAAKEVGVLGMRTVAQLALMTGANPLPGTNGIHVWKDKKGNLCLQFGIGFWRGQAEEVGGILWIDRPRAMTAEERAEYKIPDNEEAAIASGALTQEVFALLRQSREMGFEMSLSEAKNEVARVGIGNVGTETWSSSEGATNYKEAKQGRPLVWTALERAERDLLRQLVPILKRGRDNLERGTHVKGGSDWGVGQFVKLPHQTLIEDDDIESINEDLYGPDPAGGARESDVSGAPDAEEGDYQEMPEGDDGTSVELDSRVADMRASLEETEKLTVGDVLKAIIALGLAAESDFEPMIGGVVNFPKWPKGKKVAANSTLTTKGALALFDWYTYGQGDEEE